MTMDIQSAACRLFGMLVAPRGIVGVLAWPDRVRPRIRVFIGAGFTAQMLSVPLQFEGFPVEVEMRGEAIPFGAGPL